MAFGDNFENDFKTLDSELKQLSNDAMFLKAQRAEKILHMLLIVCRRLHGEIENLKG